MPWSPKNGSVRDSGETPSQIARQMLLSTPADKLKRKTLVAHPQAQSIDGRFSLSPSHQMDGSMSLARAKPMKKLYKDFPLAVADPNRMRDMGTDFGNSLAGTNKFNYRVQSPPPKHHHHRQSATSL